jgi:hypothetical protein
MVHYARNLLGMVGAKKRKELAAELRSIFATTSSEQALMHEALRLRLFDGLDQVTGAIPLAELPPPPLDNIPPAHQDLFKLEAPLGVQVRPPCSRSRPRTAREDFPHRRMLLPEIVAYKRIPERSPSTISEAGSDMRCTGHGILTYQSSMLLLSTEMLEFSITRNRPAGE